MISLFNQPTAHRFGLALQEHLASQQWLRFEAAVAWVRRSGTRHLLPSLRQFLRGGRSASFIVGIDIENTSREGLEDLLSLELHGQAETFVYHNESGAIFHPKLCFFRDDRNGCLIVGSNNFTEAGLFTNTEVGLQSEGPLIDDLFAQVQTALDSWRDPASGFARRLTRDFLQQLVDQDYVRSEAALQQQRQAQQRTAAREGDRRKPLFRSQAITLPQTQPTAEEADLTGHLLLMRVRRASETARRTQIQLSRALRETPFFEGVNEIESASDHRRHRIREARARGRFNTFKVEIPEIESMADPVLRLEQTRAGIVYEAYDAAVPTTGRAIMDALRFGQQTSPVSTHLTKPTNPASSTWWRFI